MKIALGSTSEDKKKILIKALEANGLEAEVICFNVSSGIGDQPMSEEETIQGAINRAKGARKESPNCKFSVGLEGGLQELKGSLYLVCAAVIHDSHEELHIGVSSKLKLPKSVSERVQKGESFGQVIREYKDINSNNKGLVKLLDKLISREEPFFQAINSAFSMYKHE